MSVNTALYYEKLANHEVISEDEIVALLGEVRRFRQVAAYLAECHAATVETLPKSASQSSRARHMGICRTAAEALAGDMSGIRYPQLIENAIARCNEAAAITT